MSNNDPAADDVYPKVVGRARLQVDRISGEPILLYPEGLLKLNETGAAIVGLCDGRHTVREIAVELAGRYKTTPEAIRDDVDAYLRVLYRHTLLEWHTI